MSGQVEKIVLNKLDKFELSENIEESLREDNISESCYTNFKDALIDTIIQMVREILQKDDWKIKAFEKNKEEKIFDAFMKNSEFKVLLSKSNDTSKEVIVKLDFPEDEKKQVAETYIDNILEGYYYLDICLFVEVEEELGEEVNVDTVSKILSNEVYGLLSPEEIKAKFKDKIEEAINIVFGYDVDYEVNDEEE